MGSSLSVVMQCRT